MENEQEETYDEPDWIDRHSVNCFICGKLVDERDCIPGSDGEGSICPDCQVNYLIWSKHES